MRQSSVPTRELRRRLTQAGFYVDRVAGTHFIYKHATGVWIRLAEGKRMGDANEEVLVRKAVAEVQRRLAGEVV